VKRFSGDVLRAEAFSTPLVTVLEGRVKQRRFRVSKCFPNSGGASNPVPSGIEWAIRYHVEESIRFMLQLDFVSCPRDLRCADPRLHEAAFQQGVLYSGESAPCFRIARAYVSQVKSENPRTRVLASIHKTPGIANRSAMAGLGGRVSPYPTRLMR